MKTLIYALAGFALFSTSPLMACETVNKAGAHLYTTLWKTGVGVSHIGVNTYSTIVHGAMKTTTDILSW